jgi:uncharacterized protein YecE (DUF72 family)
VPFIGTAAWSIARPVADRFPAEGSGLARYAAVFNAVEINSTFYRRHRPQTFQRWVESVPEVFRFSVKLPKQITHELRLRDAEQVFEQFLADIEPLVPKLGPLLCQLPPNLAFDNDGVSGGLKSLRRHYNGTIVIEPRHPSWGTDAASDLLGELGIAQVVADPVRIEVAVQADHDPQYLRLHGKPKIYYSSYSEEEIQGFAEKLQPDAWCIFDNTASGAAIRNALDMLQLLNADRRD